MAATQVRVEAALSRSLEDLRPVVLYLDGLNAGASSIIVAMGVEADGKKHVLGLRLGSTENAVLCTDLLHSLLARGLCIDGTILCIIDGGKGPRKALVHVLGDRAVIQRCQLHKMRNVEGYLPKAKRAYVLSQMRQAYKAQTASSARKLLVQLASCLERGGHEDAAGSLREGLEETLIVLKLGSVAHADQIAVHDERCREHNELHSAHDEKRQALAHSLDDSSLGRSVDSRSSQTFRRLKGYSEMNTLVAALARLHPASNASDTVAA